MLQAITCQSPHNLFRGEDGAFDAGALVVPFAVRLADLHDAAEADITYGLFLLLVFVDVAGFVYAWHHNVDFEIMLKNLWDEETQIIWASVISFWFGSQAFAKK